MPEDTSNILIAIDSIVNLGTGFKKNNRAILPAGFDNNLIKIQTAR